MSRDQKDSRYFRIGVLGGMGPEAGVLLQQLIIRETPAEKDQDHLEVVTFTNPHVPDRTMSLEQDGGESYLQAVIESLHLLERTRVDVLVMACNTAHARFAEIQACVETPLVNIVELANREILATEGPVGILATDGTIAGGLFTIPGQPDKTVAPPEDAQREVMCAIRDIKGGRLGPGVIDRLERVILGPRQGECRRIVLGCTELSICHDQLWASFGDMFIDPLRLAAQRLVALAKGK